MAEYTPLSIKDKQHLAILSVKLDQHLAILSVKPDVAMRNSETDEKAQNTINEIAAEMGRIRCFKFDFIQIFLKDEKRLIISNVERLRRILDIEKKIAEGKEDSDAGLPEEELLYRQKALKAIAEGKEESDAGKALGKDKTRLNSQELLDREYSLIRSRRTRHDSSAVRSLENTQWIFVTTNNQVRLQAEIERIEVVLQSAEQYIENEKRALEAQPLEECKQVQAQEKESLEKILSGYKQSATGLRALGAAVVGRSSKDNSIKGSKDCGTPCRKKSCAASTIIIGPPKCLSEIFPTNNCPKTCTTNVLYLMVCAHPA